jgi:RNA polymerase sigma-70 factor (ECF subfamily)
VLGVLRQHSGRRRILEQNIADLHPPETKADSFLTGEVRVDLLRMLFVCCDEAIPEESQLVLALKTLCGFSIREIALRLFTTEANVYKRFGRARSRLQEVSFRPDEPIAEKQASRRAAVHRPAGFKTSGLDS